MKPVPRATLSFIARAAQRAMCRAEYPVPRDGGRSVHYEVQHSGDEGASRHERRILVISLLRMCCCSLRNGHGRACQDQHEGGLPVPIHDVSTPECDSATTRALHAMTTPLPLEA